MTGSSPELSKLERELLAEIAGAGDLAALEAVRVAALGKKGRVSELMASSAHCRRKSAKASGRPSTASRAKSPTRSKRARPRLRLQPSMLDSRPSAPT